MFRTVTSKPDFVAQEHEVLAQWQERRTFARLRAQNAGGPRWSFLDGPITANNPMGVHHAWGRAYKDLYQRYHAMLGEDQRYQNGFDCQGLWVEVNVERDLGFTSKRDIEARIDRFVTLCKQTCPELRTARRSSRSGSDVDGLEQPGRAAPAARPARTDRPGDDHRGVRMVRHGYRQKWSSAAWACRTSVAPYFTFSNENNDLIWGFLAEVHRRGWLYKGHDTMPWCPRCGTGLSQMEMNEGYQDREDPGLTIRFPLIDRPGEALLVWTTTPWTLTANVAAALATGPLCPDPPGR
jgi:isoleucyl-tRNA synthetase